MRRSGKTDLDAEYLVADLASFAAEPERAGAFDIVFACNVYHLLGPIGRREFAAAAAAVTRPGGLLFLSTLSPRDPEHYMVGEPVSGEERSWVDKVYLHFCNAEELERDFPEFEVIDLEERAYEEPRRGRVAAPPHELVPGGAPALSLRLAGARAPAAGRRHHAARNGLTTRSGPNARPCWKSSLYSVRQPPASAASTMRASQIASWSAALRSIAFRTSAGVICTTCCIGELLHREPAGRRLDDALHRRRGDTVELLQHLRTDDARAVFAPLHVQAFGHSLLLRVAVREEIDEYVGVEEGKVAHVRAALRSWSCSRVQVMGPTSARSRAPAR